MLQTFREYKEMNESNLSRLWKHNLEHDCGAITAFRIYEDCNDKLVKLSHEDKKKRNLALASDLKSLGYSITKVIGKYPEGNSNVLTKEVSYFVVDAQDNGKLKSDLKRLGNKYDQDSILYVPKNSFGKNSKAVLIGTNNCDDNFLKFDEELLFNNGHLGYSSPIYTSYKNGRPFIFENIEIDETGVFSSGFSAMAAEKYSNKIEETSIKTSHHHRSW